MRELVCEVMVAGFCQVATCGILSVMASKFQDPAWKNPVFRSFISALHKESLKSGAAGSVAYSKRLNQLTAQVRAAAVSGAVGPKADIRGVMGPVADRLSRSRGGLGPQGPVSPRSEVSKPRGVMGPAKNVRGAGMQGPAKPKGSKSGK